MDVEAQFEEIGKLYRRLATKHELDFEEVTTPARALTDDEIAQVEELTGCKMPPLAPAFYKSEVARRSPAGVPPFRDFYTTGEDLLARCQELRVAKDEYSWNHDPLIPLTAEEDFLACTADGAVVRFCGNEGNADSEDGVENLEQVCKYSRAVPRCRTRVTNRLAHDLLGDQCARREAGDSGAGASGRTRHKRL